MGIVAVCYVSLMIEDIRGQDDTYTDPYDCAFEPTEQKKADCYKACHHNEVCVEDFNEYCTDFPNEIPNCYTIFTYSLGLAIQDLATKADKCGVSLGENNNGKKLSMSVCNALEQSEDLKVCYMQCFLDDTCREEMKHFCLASSNKDQCFGVIRKIMTWIYKALKLATASC